jgi:hypothetical protein
MERITLGPGEEFFIAPPGEKQRAYAHIGITQGELVRVHDPYRAYKVRYTAPFPYGNGYGILQIDRDLVGKRVKRNCWGLTDAEMFTIIKVDPAQEIVVIDVHDGMAVFPREESDKTVADAL